MNGIFLNVRFGCLSPVTVGNRFCFRDYVALCKTVRFALVLVRRDNDTFCITLLIGVTATLTLYYNCEKTLPLFLTMLRVFFLLILVFSTLILRHLDVITCFDSLHDSLFLALASSLTCCNFYICCAIVMRNYINQLMLNKHICSECYGFPQ